MRLEEAVAAYRKALKEYTRERMPLQWAAVLILSLAVCSAAAGSALGAKRLLQLCAHWGAETRPASRHQTRIETGTHPGSLSVSGYGPWRYETGP
jgi:hypothetical protein